METEKLEQQNKEKENKVDMEKKKVVGNSRKFVSEVS